jgi:hypothetical protein
MSPDPEFLSRNDAVLLKLDSLTRSLRPVDGETARLYQVISALSDATKTNYLTLRNALDNGDQTLIAWSCRNLLELSVFTQFVLESKVNTDQFVEDRLIDGHQMAIALKELESYLNPGLTESVIDATLDAFQKQKEKEGITDRGYSNIRVLAAQVGMGKEFETVNKVCSKFVHPTAWSLLTADVAAERFPEGVDLLFASGAKYFVTIYVEILGHVTKWGLRHKE